MTPEAVQQLFDRYVSEELTREEFFALWQTLNEEEFRQQWQQQVESVLQSGGYEDLADNTQQAAVLAAMLQETAAPAPVRKIPQRVRWWMAAAGVFALGFVGYWWLQPKEKISVPVVQTKKVDLPPGREGAVLTLADGSQVVIDSTQHGIIATQNGTKVVLNDQGISYGAADKQENSVVYNAMSTPKGRQFHVQLPDGTEVWLNAASSIRYPTAFTGAERKVAITGEVYFEVAKNKAKPFIVEAAGKLNVEVLGTHFNVNAYPDEPAINTTLLEGSVKVTDQQQSVVLKPGQQARVNSEGMKVINQADLAMAVAWKEGTFQFNYTRLDEILRQFARWYDVTVIYEQRVPDFVLSGAIRRDFTLSEALMTLEKMGLHYRIEEKKLIVLP